MLLLKNIRFDQAPLPLVVIAGVIIGLSIAIPGFLFLQGQLWIIFWLCLLAGLGWLGFSAVPKLKESSPIAATPYRVQDGNAVPIMMMDLPGGEFLMGSPDSGDMADDNEKPQHKVTVSSFRIALTPVTVAQYREVMGGDPPVENEAQLPITRITWYQAIEFCNELSRKNGFKPCYSKRLWYWRCDWRADGFRLPTEAEWEFACRAGSKTRYCFGDDEKELERYSWYRENSQEELQAVATKLPNTWGLFDMHGNVWEWCWDWYGPYTKNEQNNPTGPWMKLRNRWRVLRGGSFIYTPAALRSAFRLGNWPEDGGEVSGFRCVRVPSH